MYFNRIGDNIMLQDDFEPIDDTEFHELLDNAKEKHLKWATGEIHDINKFIDWEDPEDCELYRNIEDNCLLLIGK